MSIDDDVALRWIFCIKYSELIFSLPIEKWKFHQIHFIMSPQQIISICYITHTLPHFIANHFGGKRKHLTYDRDKNHCAKILNHMQNRAINSKLKHHIFNLVGEFMMLLRIYIIFVKSNSNLNLMIRIIICIYDIHMPVNIRFIAINRMLFWFEKGKEKDGKKHTKSYFKDQEWWTAFFSQCVLFIRHCMWWKHSNFATLVNA